MPQLRSEGGAAVATSEQALSVGARRSGTSNAAYDKLKPGPGRSATEVARHQRARIHSAMVESIAELGYDAVTVRELARVAGVSSRTFYQHYTSKDDCFWGVYQLIARRMLRSVGAAQARTSDRKELLACTIETIIQEWTRDPRAARLLLIDAYMVRPGSSMRTRRVHLSLAARVRASIEGATGSPAPPFLVEGIVAGVIGLVRTRLLNQQYDSLSDLGRPLGRWAASLQNPDPVEIEAHAALQIPSNEEAGALVSSGDHALLLSAAAKLVTAEECESVTAAKIFNAAGIPRRRFYENFAQAEDVFVAVMELCMREALARAERACEGHEPEDGVCQVVAALCAQVAQAPTFARLCFSEMVGMRMPMIESRQRFAAAVTELIEKQMPSSTAVGDLAIEASVAALIGALGSEVAMGRAAQAPWLTGYLVHLLLAPTSDTLTARAKA